MQKVEKLNPGVFYHIYNRGNGGINIFKEQKNYNHFLMLWIKHIEPVAESYAYCLLKNHFHFIVRVNSIETLESLIVEKQSKQSIQRFVSQQFSNCFNAYTKAFNKMYNYSGSLFEERFERTPIENKKYLSNCIRYLHLNPEKHGFVEHFADWNHSSYNSHLSKKQTRLMRMSVLELFGGEDVYTKEHTEKVNFDDKVLDIFERDMLL
ncbi:hypothetical protein SAMN06298216_3847 [Spirosomataceae bacterium TFI 002]|nr:hypothetical protein SAMN06298216_3847 [Spirosomataceae bacterium TFI 002]